MARGRAGAGVILDILALEDGEVPEQQRLVRHDVERVCGKETEAHTTARQPVSLSAYEHDYIDIRGREHSNIAEVGVWGLQRLGR